MRFPSLICRRGSHGGSSRGGPAQGARGFAASTASKSAVALSPFAADLAHYQCRLQCSTTSAPTNSVVPRRRLGLGKTVQAIALLADWHKRPTPPPHRHAGSLLLTGAGLETFPPSDHTPTHYCPGRDWETAQKHAWSSRLRHASRRIETMSRPHLRGHSDESKPSKTTPTQTAARPFALRPISASLSQARRGKPPWRPTHSSAFQSRMYCVPSI